MKMAQFQQTNFGDLAAATFGVQVATACITRIPDLPPRCKREEVERVPFIKEQQQPKGRIPLQKKDYKGNPTTLSSAVLNRTD
ncbi:hypothetical protein FRC20_010316 [Serendipita sp. 405]|nr:hypothetical protein FRC20_010316 [Serendipita sp. 405]